jgi:hypothetical protein
MKIRNGFVSNSSSSSFTCAVCGHTESGWDMGLRDCGMVESQWGQYCESHLIESLPDKPTADCIKDYNENCDDKDKWSLDDWWEDWKSELGHEVPDELCPLFNLKVIDDSDKLNYLLKSHGWTMKEVEDSIRVKFANLKELRQYVK